MAFQDRLFISLSVGPSVIWSVDLSVIISQKGGKLHFHAPIEALVFNQVKVERSFTAYVLTTTKLYMDLCRAQSYSQYTQCTNIKISVPRTHLAHHGLS